MQKVLLALVASLFFLAGCVRPSQTYEAYKPEDPESASPTSAIFSLPARDPNAPYLTPTPDLPRVLPTLRTDTEAYVIQAGDTLGLIAQRYGVPLQNLITANQIADPNLVSPGQQLVIPPPNAGEPGSGFKIIPDSELVYGPSTVILNLPNFVQAKGGYLIGYQEKVGDSWLTGPQILDRVAHEYSVNPRILLAALEYQSGWVTKNKPAEETLEYPMRWFDPNYKGLYRQLAWTANNLNRGYYLWKVNAIAAWTLADGSVVPPDATINAGTAAVQHFFGLLYARSDWEQAIGPNGFYQIFFQFFGFPFDYTIDPLVPAKLAQPAMQLPFKKGETWSFTGGPHGGWGSGSAWAAIDFAPPGEGKGCAQSDAWVRAVADGKILRSENGVVILDLDADGYEQTGWTVLYLHIETRDRVAADAEVKAGDRIGHPSCEGGVSNGTHVHMARRYNGEWISADGNLPFDLDGWVSQGTGYEYDGKLIRNGKTVEAWEFFTPENQISR